MRSKIPIAFSLVLVLLLQYLCLSPIFAESIFNDGFETGDMSKWSMNHNAVVTDNPIAVHNGKYGANCTWSDGDWVGAGYVLPSPLTTIYFVEYIKLDSLPYDHLQSFGYMSENEGGGGNTYHCDLYNDSGVWHWYFWHAGTMSVVDANVSAGAWWSLQIGVTPTWCAFWINGELQENDTGTFSSVKEPFMGMAHYESGGYSHTVYIDDIYIGTTLDMTPPTFGNVSTNANVAGQTCIFSCLVNDNVNVSTYIFSTNNTGAWINDTVIAFLGFFNTTAAWANVTKTLNETVGNTVSYIWYANDTSNNWSSSDQYNLTLTTTYYFLTISATEGGTTNPPPETYSYAENSQLQVTADPETNYEFEYWELDGDNVGSANPYLVLMDGNHTLRAVFSLVSFTLTVTTVDSGSVSLNNTGPYYYGDVVELTAVPAVGWSFQSWSGDLLGSVNPTTLVIDSNKTVTATFTWIEYALTVTVVGSGSVSRNNTGPYYYGDVVELTAVPYGGWSFQGWSGDLLGTSNPDTLTIDGNKDVTATFILIKYHDVAVTDVLPFKTVVEQGYSTRINVTVANQGDYAETFNVTLYANTTAIETQTVILSIGNSANITFTWDTTGFAKGNYTIKATADTDSSENDTLNNNLTDGWIIVAMVGDITGDSNGYPDGRCNMIDIGIAARLFMINYPDTRYNPNCDINDDGKIDMEDIATLARHFGETDP